MHRHSETPLLARLSAIIAGTALCACVTVAAAQSNPQQTTQAVTEIQRLMRQNQMPQALDKADALIAARPREAQGRFMKGLILTEMGRQNDAIAVFTKLTEDFPELPEPYNNLAVLYAQQKRYDKARSALEMAIRTHPSYAVAHENLGDVYAKLASQAYDKALQIDSSNTATQSKLSMIKDLISTSSKPGTKPAALRTEPEPAKVAAAPVKAPEPVAKPVPPPAPAVAAAPAKAPEPALKPATETKPAVAAKPAEPAPAEVKAADKTVSLIEAEVTKALQNWARAWSNKDMRAYLASYASDFQLPGGMNRKAWEAERTQRIDKPGKLQVSVDDVKITINGDKATVRFRQRYVSATLKSSVGKTMVFAKSGSKWLIVQERVG